MYATVVRREGGNGLLLPDSLLDLGDDGLELGVAVEGREVGVLHESPRVQDPGTAQVAERLVNVAGQRPIPGQVAVGRA